MYVDTLAERGINIRMAFNDIIILIKEKTAVNLQSRKIVYVLVFLYTCSKRQGEQTRFT